jgi:chromosome segregation ATPase
MCHVVKIFLSVSLLFLFSNKAYCSLARQIASYQTEIRTLQSSLMTKEEENLILKTNISSLEKEISESLEQKQQLQYNLSDLQEKQEQLLIALNSVQSKTGSALSYHSDPSISAKPLKPKIIKSHFKRKQHLINELNEVKTSVSKLKNNLAEEVNKEETLRQKYEELKHQKDSLVMQVEALKTEKESLSQKLGEHELLLKQQDEQRKMEAQASNIREKALEEEVKSLVLENEKQYHVIQEKSQYQERLVSQIKAIAETVGAEGDETPTRVVPKLKTALTDARARALIFESQVEELQAQIACLTQERDATSNSSVPNDSVSSAISPLTFIEAHSGKREIYQADTPKQEPSEISINPPLQGLPADDNLIPSDTLIKAIASKNKEVSLRKSVYLPGANQEDTIEVEIPATGPVEGRGEKTSVKSHNPDSNLYTKEAVQIPNPHMHSYPTSSPIEEKCCILF